jgi:FkbM family methyltransferase
MTFISYAQNCEDIMLFRALRDIEQGFYVDVGANSPDEHSVTKAFYDRGWRGINIEPVMEFHQQLLAARPRDVNLPIAVADTTGFIDFYDVPGTGLSTISPKIAEDHRAAGYEVVKRNVVVETLDEVFRKYVSGDVHFLKIDVEGLEDSVLRGISLEEVRPWIIVVEATEVLSEVQNHASWEHLLKDRGYSFVYFDGLNRFYVAREHSDLARFFQSPPNVFDDWMRVGDRRAHDRANVLSDKLREEQDAHGAELRILRAQVEEWKTKAEALEVTEEARRADEAARRAEEAARRAEDEARRVELEARLDELMRTMEEAAALRTGIAEMREEFGEWARLREQTAAAEALAAEQAAAADVLAARQAAAADVLAARQAAAADVVAAEEAAAARVLAAEEAAAAGIVAAERAAAEAATQAAAREAELAAQVAAVAAEATALRHRVAELEYTAAVTKLNLDAMVASSSWRITAPIRAVKTAVVSRAKAVGAVVAGGRQPGGSLVKRAAHWSARQPMIKRAAVAVLVRSPALERKVRAIVAPPPGVQPVAVAHIPQPRQIESSGPAVVSRNPSPAEAIVETAFQRALARAR